MDPGSGLFFSGSNGRNRFCQVILPVTVLKDGERVNVTTNTFQRLVARDQPNHRYRGFNMVISAGESPIVTYELCS